MSNKYHFVIRTFSWFNEHMLQWNRCHFYCYNLDMSLTWRNSKYNNFLHSINQFISINLITFIKVWYLLANSITWNPSLVLGSFCSMLPTGFINYFLCYNSSMIIIIFFQKWEKHKWASCSKIEPVCFLIEHLVYLLCK